MRIPLGSQYIFLLLTLMLTCTMSINPLKRIYNPLNLCKNGQFTKSYSFVISRFSRNDSKDYSKTLNLNSVDPYSNYNEGSTVSTAYPNYNNGNQTIPSFTQVPNYNYNVIPNQYGYQSSMPMNGYNSYRPTYSRPNYNYYSRNYNKNYNTQPYRRYGTPTSKSFEITLTPVDWENQDLVEIKKDFYDLSYEADSRPGEEIEAILKSHNIIIEGEHPLPKPVNTFDEAVFNEQIQKIIKDSKFIEPTPIQKVGWTSCLTGRDVVGVSQTGSGKTLTFLLPGLLHLLAQPPVGNGGPIMLVLAPTRELCLQIARESKPYSDLLNLRLSTVYGGVPKYSQIKECSEGVDVMVATPGRLIDLLSTGNIRLNRVSYFVMDEADRMLDMGFEPQIRKIVSQIRPDRQTLMFSATWPMEIRRLASEFCKQDFIYIQVGDLELTANPNIIQNVHLVNSYEVKDRLFTFLDNMGQNKKVLIFSETKTFADQLASNLRYKKLRAASLHGDKTQTQRENILNMFRNGEYNILVATDIASRGLDIKDIDYVINLEAPNTLLDYIHRIGRTARGGNKGESILFFAKDTMTPSKSKFAHDLSNLLSKVNQAIPPELMQLANHGRYRL